MIFGKKKKVQEPAPAPGPIVEFERTYPSLSRFKGTKKLHVTTYGDIYHGMENAMQLLGDEDKIYSSGKEITLSGFKYENGTGIRVALDGTHLGVVWTGPEPAEAYSAAYSGSIEGVFVLIERDGAYNAETKEIEPRAKVSLFVKLPE